MAVLRYGDGPTLGRLGMVFLCGLLASLLKLPAFSHLGQLVGALVWLAHGFRFLFRPTHWIAAFLLLATIKGWSGYVTAVNTAGFPEWTAESTLRGFFGDPMARLNFALYIKVAGYITAFLLSPLGVIIAAFGLWQAFLFRKSDKGFFILAWTASLVFYVLVWGTQTASAHSYYNLPMLIPCAMLFGMGMGCSMEWIEAKKSGNFESALSSQTSPLATRHSSRQILFSTIVALLILIPMAVMTSYLFREDRVLLAAADWINKNVPPGQPVAVKLNHSPYYIDYMHVPTVSYYSGHPCFMLTKYTPYSEYADAMEKCSFIVETLSRKEDGINSLAIEFKRAARPADELEKFQVLGFKRRTRTSDGLGIWTKPD